MKKNINIFNEKCKLYQNDYDIVILAGQSNAMGYGKGQIDFQEKDNILELYRKDKYNTAKNPKFPIRQYVFKIAGIRNKKMSGFYLTFAKHYEQDLLTPDRKLLIIRTAVGGTGFSDNCWGINNHLFQNTIRMVKQVLQANKNNRVVCVLWHQGETDVINNVTQEYYKEKFEMLINGMRSELNIEDVPFVAGDMVPEWCETQHSVENVRKAVKEVVGQLDNCYFVESTGLTGNGSDDIIHFSSKSNEMLGLRYYDKFTKSITKKIDLQV